MFFKLPFEKMIHEAASIQNKVKKQDFDFRRQNNAYI